MKMIKKTSVAGAFARKEPYTYENKDYDADIKNGDRVVIKSGGDIVTGEFGDQMVFVVATRNGDKNANFNQSSVNVLIDSYGDDSAAWVGKEVKVLTKKGMFGGKRAIAAYFVTDDYVLDDFGDLVRADELDYKAPAPISTPSAQPAYPAYTGAPSFPAEEINKEDIPF
jgi:hypothetical protein